METIKDIVEEMRSGPFNWSYPEGIPQMQRDNDGVRAFADRIEAAYERESTCEKYSQVGDGAKMREAVEMINSIDTIGLKRLLWQLVEADIFDGGIINRTVSVVEKARRALAEPPRNCDLFDLSRSKEEYKKYRTEICLRESNPFIANDTTLPFDEWLFAKAKGESDGINK